MILQDKNTASTGSLYHKKMCDATQSVIEENDGIVTKTFVYNRFKDCKDWLKSYKNLRSWDCRYVEVYEIGDDFIKMKYVPETVPVIQVIRGYTDHSIDDRLKIISEYVEVLSMSHIYISNSSEVFLHNDLSPYNVLVNKKNELTIIDPDACDYHPRFERLLPDLISNYTTSMYKYYEVLQHKVSS